jgi:(S)-2-hydroxyglutarate dehydrogenase
MSKVLIIGAGIVGLATALKILEKQPDATIILVEKEPGPARHQTGNNSGVIHAGIYYKPGSLKALNCINGYQALLGFCDKEELSYDLCGKLIVATRPEEIPRLSNLYERSQQNGLIKVKKIPREEIDNFEPHVTGLEALYVPYTGIIDYKKVAGKYAQIIQERYGATIEYNNEVLEIRKTGSAVNVITDKRSYTADFIINTAGLHSDKIALMTDENIDVRIIPFRGEYVELKPDKQYLVKNLIYPVPDPNFPFLGVHFTRMIDGGIEAGPNAVWAFSREGYKFNQFDLNNVLNDLKWPGFRKVMQQYWKMGMGEYYRSFNKNALVNAMQQLIPEISKNDFTKGGAGVRAQACDRKGGLIDDFLIRENKWAINVLNAPSPAATASLAIGESIAELAFKRI